MKNALKTASNKASQKTANATSDLVGSAIADKIIMEYQKTKNWLDNTPNQPPKFKVRKLA